MLAYAQAPPSYVAVDHEIGNRHAHLGRYSVLAKTLDPDLGGFLFELRLERLASKTVHVPTSNLFDVSQVRSIMEAIGDGGAV